MAEPLENPVIKELEAEEAALLAATKVAEDKGQTPGQDSSAEIPAPSAAEPVTTEVETVSTPDSSETSAAQERARDEQGRFVAKEAETEQKQEQETQQAHLEQKPDSAYTKAQKEAARKEKTWQQINEEKARIAQEKAQIEAAKRELEAQRHQPVQPAKDEFTSKQYEDYAREARRSARDKILRGEVDEAAGDLDLAEKAEKAAAALRENEHKTQHEQQKAGFERTWRENMDATIREIPELADRESVLGKKLVEVFQMDPVFNYIPDGFKKAARVAQLLLTEAKVSELEGKVNQLEAELAKANGKIAVGGSSPTSPVPTKRFEDMTIGEMEAYLQRQSDRAIAA